MSATPTTTDEVRGVWLDPGMGPNGEFAVSVTDSTGRRLLTSIIPHQYDKDVVIAELYGLLDRLDPVGKRAPSSIPLQTGKLRRPGASRPLALVKGGDHG
jgi:hypothetical protein